MWTLDELVDRVHAALVAAGYPGAPNGRVRDLPDRRAVRWYATTGLVDRPSAMRGRVALYGPRHLLQLVAVKRRQAEGRTLAEIQAELAGATDATLAAIARVPDDLLAVGEAPAEPEPTRTRFWATSPATAPTQPPATPAEPATPEPTAAEPAAAANGSPAAPAAPVVPNATVDDVPATLAGVALGGGAVLLLPAHPRSDDLEAITRAARPLLGLLADRGLLAPGRSHRKTPLTDPDPRADRGPRTHRSPS